MSDFLRSCHFRQFRLDENNQRSWLSPARSTVSVLSLTAACGSDEVLKLNIDCFWLTMASYPTHSRPLAEVIKQAQQWLLICLCTSYSDIHLHLLNCGHGLTQRQLHHVASVHGAKVLISSFAFSLSRSLFLSHISRVTAGQLVLPSSLCQSLKKSGKIVGEKQLLSVNPTCGCVDVGQRVDSGSLRSWAWDWVPPPPLRLICFTAPLERLTCFPLWHHTHTTMTNMEVYETPLIKGRSHCSLQYDILWNGVSGWSNFPQVKRAAVLQFMDSLLTFVWAPGQCWKWLTPARAIWRAE